MPCFRFVLIVAVLGAGACSDDNDDVADATARDDANMSMDGTVADGPVGDGPIGDATGDAMGDASTGCEFQPVTMTGNPVEATLRRSNLIGGAMCPLLFPGNGGMGPIIANFERDGTYRASFGILSIRTASHGDLTRPEGANHRLDNLPENTDITVESVNGETLVFSFAGDVVTVVSWSAFQGPVDPANAPITGACLQMIQGTRLDFRVFFDAPGLRDLTVEADASADLVAFGGSTRTETFTNVEGTIDDEAVAPLTFATMDPPRSMRLAISRLELVTADAGGAPVRTNVLDGLNAALGGQPELDDMTGTPTGSMLPAGTYQFQDDAHPDSPSHLISGDCTPPYRR
ncbi:MAG: hypothetical protein AAGF12_15545 [Myxococcota bacterium]